MQIWGTINLTQINVKWRQKLRLKIIMAADFD